MSYFKILDPEEAQAEIVRALGDNSAYVVVTAMSRLIAVQKPSSLSHLVPLLQHQDEVRRWRPSLGRRSCRTCV